MDYSVKKEYIMQAKHFFEPFVGDNYSEGIYGKRVLVLGASFYCNQDGVSVDKETGEVKEKCPFYDDCAINQNTEKYDGKCPYNHNSPLRKLPQTELDENGAESYKRFWLLLYHYFQQPELSFDDIWGKMAFTNYVQHEIGGRWNTLASDCRAEYLEMFEDTLLTMKEQPDVVIVWGCIVDKPLKAKTYSDRFPDFENTFTDKDHYRFKWKNFNGKDIEFLCFFQPSSSDFYSDKEWDFMLDRLEDVFRLQKGE